MLTATSLQILFVVSRLPYALTTGDRVRAYNFIQELARRGHRVDLLALAQPEHRAGPLQIADYCERVEVVDHPDTEFLQPNRFLQLHQTVVGAYYGYPRRVWEFHSPEMLQRYTGLLRENRYDLIHFSEIGAAEVFFYTPDYLQTPRVFDLIDAVSLSVQNSLRFRKDITWPMRLLEAPALRKFELRLLSHADAGVVISPRDKEHLGDPEKLHVIPMGIDIAPRIASPALDLDIIFSGNMAARPNVDAAIWFAKMVMPLIWQERPETRLHIVGRTPAPEVQSLAADRVIVTGAVDNMNEYLQAAKVAVAPLRFGAGQKTKLLEAFANGVAVVATSEANEGTNAVDGESILIADDAQSMASAVLSLLMNGGRRSEFARCALEFVRQKYSWSKVVEQLEAVYWKALHREHTDSAS